MGGFFTLCSCYLTKWCKVMLLAVSEFSHKCKIPLNNHHLYALLQF
jgi:hypothetical protein